MQWVLRILGPGELFPEALLDAKFQAKGSEGSLRSEGDMP